MNKRKKIYINNYFLRVVWEIKRFKRPKGFAWFFKLKREITVLANFKIIKRMYNRYLKTITLGLALLKECIRVKGVCQMYVSFVV